MRIQYKLYLTLCLAFIISSCGNNADKMSISDAVSLIQTSTNLTIIDVRTSDEFFSENIEGSINIDVLSANFTSRVGVLNKTNSYFLYSQSPVRANSALQMMTNLGFSNVHILNGNYEDLLPLLLND